MSISTRNPRTETRDVVPATPPSAAPRREHRERDFGVGYGNSSGYASHRRYASNWSEPRFRCS